MRLLELHCDYVKVKPKQKALKSIGELSEQEKNGTSMENVLVVFSTFEEGDDENILDRACSEVKKNFNEVKASAVLVYPYAHLSAKLAKPSIAQALLDKFLEKVKIFAPESKKTPFGYYKEFELKCKGHPLAELSKTISAETVAALGPAAVGASASGAVGANDTYRKLIELLNRHNAHYRLIDHPPEGRTEIVSPMRGNKVSQAAKCIVIMVKLAKRETKYVLGVVPGDAKVDLNAVKELFSGTYISFATSDIAEKLAGSVVGTILPFSFNSDLELIVDPSLLENDELFFNAARLDQSMALKTKDYIAVAKPRLEQIAKYSGQLEPAASVSSTSPSSALEKKIMELGAKDTELFPRQSMFLDYAKPTKKTLTQTNSLEAQRNTAVLLVAMAAEELLDAKIATAFAKDDEAYVDFESKPINEETMKAIERQANVIREKAMAIKVKKATELKAANKFQKEAAEESGEKEFLVAEVQGKEYWLPGPFTKNTNDAKAFLLTKFGGSYWKNNAKNAPLQRIHLIAAGTAKEIEKYAELQKEAEKRDHRAIGKQLELFSFHDEGTGFPFYHPNGVVVRNELMAYLREEFQSRGYKEINTPIILNEDLWHRSGHWDHYRENMYFTSIDSVPHAVKPMNCPGGMLVYKSRPHSYRELPLRLAEFGMVHRHELSGVLSGLFRVRAFTQDDAHVYCTHEQIHYEVLKMLEFMDDVYSTFGFEYRIALSTKPEKAMGSPEMWAKAEEALTRALKENKKPFEIHEGDGAFYGPKIDFKIKDALGREWQCGTIQLDFQMPENFDLTYEGSDGKKHRPAMLHRAIYGSLERFLGVLIEHFAGAFPTWLSPVQVILLPLTDDDVKYADEVFTKLQAKGIRLELDSSTGKIQGKIRDAQLRKIPYMLVVGKKEAEARTLSVRKRDGTVNQGVKLDAFASSLLEEIVERKL